MSSTLLEAKYQDTFFVSPSGSNSTGEKGNISLPFATIAGARNAATGSSGYNRLIYVFPGTYEEQGLAYSGSFYFLRVQLYKPQFKQLQQKYHFLCWY